MSENYTPFKMKGFSGFGEGTKGTPAKFVPSYKHTEHFDEDTGEWVDKKTMISDKEADKIEKQLATNTQDEGVFDVSRTGMALATHGIKGFKKAGGSKTSGTGYTGHGPGGYSKPTTDTTTGKIKHHTAITSDEAKKQIVKGVTQSATDTDVISEEKIQAQLFPEDVKASQRAINIEKQSMNLPVGDEMKQRGEEATAVIEEKEEEKKKTT